MDYFLITEATHSKEDYVHGKRPKAHEGQDSKDRNGG